MERITSGLDLKESLETLVLRVSRVMTGDQAQPERQAGGDPTAEEDHLDSLALLAGLVRGVRLESPVSLDLEVHQGQTDHRDSKGRKETPDQGGLGEALERLEKRAGEELLAVRESPESQDRRVSRGRWGQEENPEKMAEMGLEFLDLKEGRETKASRDTQDLKGRLEILELKVDLEKQGTEDRGVSLETWVPLVSPERSDILGHMERKVLAVLGSCNVTWLRRSEIIAFAVMAKTSVLYTRRSSPSPWTCLKTWARRSTACARPS